MKEFVLKNNKSIRIGGLASIGYCLALAATLAISGCGTFSNMQPTAWDRNVEAKLDSEQFDTRGYADYQARQKAERVPKASCGFG
ncbi:MAG: hypothetical protein ACI9G1_001568 [Pirellulaceae bacterium]|jgi:hypothetical protein